MSDAALEALVRRLLEKCGEIHICYLCGRDLLSGTWFLDHNDECELADAARLLRLRLDMVC